jgi:hypothetical protein
MPKHFSLDRVDMQHIAVEREILMISRLFTHQSEREREIYSANVHSRSFFFSMVPGEISLSRSNDSRMAVAMNE